MERPVIKLELADPNEQFVLVGRALRLNAAGNIENIVEFVIQTADCRVEPNLVETLLEEVTEYSCSFAHVTIVDIDGKRYTGHSLEEVVDLSVKAFYTHFNKVN